MITIRLYINGEKKIEFNLNTCCLCSTWSQYAYSFGLPVFMNLVAFLISFFLHNGYETVNGCDVLGHDKIEDSFIVRTHT